MKPLPHHHFHTCQAESEDGEKNQDVEGDYCVLDGWEGVQVTAALILLPAALCRTWWKQKKAASQTEQSKPDSLRCVTGRVLWRSSGRTHSGWGFLYSCHSQTDKGGSVLMKCRIVYAQGDVLFLILWVCALQIFCQDAGIKLLMLRNVSFHVWKMEEI